MLLSREKWWSIDNLFVGTTKTFALLVFFLVFAIVASLIKSSYPSFEAFGFKFFTTDIWDPVAEQFSSLAAMSGTLLTALIALVVGVPLSFGIAIFISEIAPTWLKRPLSITIELMAGIPSIIYGMWGLFILAPLMAKYVQPFLHSTVGTIPIIGHLFSGPMTGIGLFTAGLILAVMVIPLIAAVMQDLLTTVPTVIREAAYGTGATRWEVIWHVVVPYIRTGLFGSVILGFGRALGETMAVTFVIGNAHKLTTALFSPGTSISAVIANEFAEATGALYPAALLELGLILFFITFIVLAFARLLLYRYKH